TVRPGRRGRHFTDYVTHRWAVGQPLQAVGYLPRFCYQGERTTSWIVIAVATCAASRYRTARCDVVPAAVGAAATVAIRTHGRHGSQIRSTSPFDHPLRSA